MKKAMRKLSLLLAAAMLICMTGITAMAGGTVIDYGDVRKDAAISIDDGNGNSGVTNKGTDSSDKGLIKIDEDDNIYKIGDGALATLNPVTVTATVADNKLTVKVSNLKANAQTTLMILPVTDETALPTPADVEAETDPVTPWYIGQETADANGEYTYTFDVAGKSGKYIAYAGGEERGMGVSSVFDLSAPAAPAAKITKVEAATEGADIVNVPQDMAFADYIVKVKLTLENADAASKTFTAEDVTNGAIACDNWADIAKAEVGGKVKLKLKYKYSESVTLEAEHEVTVAAKTDIFVNGANEKVVVNARLVDSAEKHTISSLTTSETGYVILSVSGFDETKKFDGGTISFTFSGVKLYKNDITTYGGVTMPSDNDAITVGASTGTIPFKVSSKSNITGTSFDVAKIKISSTSAISSASVQAMVDSNLGYIALTRAEGDKSMLKAEVGSAASFEIKSTGGGGGGGTGGGGGGSAAIGGTGTVVTPIATPVPTVPSTADGAFADVSNHWAKDAVKYVADKGIIKGKGDGNFYPDDTVTRAELTAMAVRAMGLAESTYQGRFTDVNANEWFATIVQAALEANLISDADAFRPNDLVTREEMAKIFIGIAQALNVLQELPQDYQATFTDMGAVSEWATNYVNVAGYNGFMSGMTDGSFSPRGNATRAEAATVISRILQKQ